MPTRGFDVAHYSDIEPVPMEPGDPEWRPVRHHFGLLAFGTGLFRGAQPGDMVIEEHDERVDDEAGGHEELYFVAGGHAEFVVDGDVIDAPAGTFVVVRDTDLVRSARAKVSETLVLAVGGPREEAYEVSDWEKRYLGRAGISDR